MDKKFLYIFGGVIALLVIFVIFAVLVSMMGVANLGYQQIEDKMVEATKSYVTKEKDLALDSGEYLVVSTETLVSKGYLKELSKYNKDECSGQVVVMNNNKLLNYIPQLNCSKYTTKTLVDKIIEDNLVVDSQNPYQSGLYEQNGEYIFKGKSPNNYFSFGSSVVWRIIKIDADGNIRLIKAEQETESPWDNKFNPETNSSSGKNEYRYSELRSRLINGYNGLKEENRRRLIPHDVCVGSRAIKDYTLSTNIDCSEILSDQYISTLNTIELSMASLDENCDSIRNGNCLNYNYFSGFVRRSWTTISVSDNTYEAYTVSTGSISRYETRERHGYYWVVYLSGREVYKSGSGTKTDPYVLHK